jgi:hypothetical protein
MCLNVFWMVRVRARDIDERYTSRDSEGPTTDLPSGMYETTIFNILYNSINININLCITVKILLCVQM